MIIKLPFQRTKVRARRALLVQFFLMGFIFASFLSRFPSLQELYHLSIGQLSLIPFCMSIGSLGMTPFCAFFVHKYGCKRLSVMGYVYIIILPFLTLMPNLYCLYALCMIYGAMVSLTDVAINANSILVEKVYHRPILTLFHALFYIGMCSGALLSIVFLAFKIPVMYHLFIVSFLALNTFYIIRNYFLKETPGKDRSQDKFRVLFPKGILLLIAFIAFCGRIIEGSISDWSTVYMKTIVDLSETVAPVGLAIYSAFIAFGRFFGDSIRKRYGSSAILLACCITTGTGLLILISGTQIYFAIAGLFISGVGLSYLVPVIYSLAGNQKDVSPGEGLAMVNMISGTGFLFGPFVIGMIADAYNMRVSFLYVFGLTLIMLLLTTIFRKKEQTKP
ncbi:MFS transporter [Bacteroidia bacterium]|nr:MFS transporter [Bacteroidia bacterium]GHT02655.1 MFS transporter [Bacteroidia bacterium]GHT45798.1 MFS transporter [Bacteroidia bacterium]